MAEEKPLLKEVTDAVTDREAPLGEVEPGAPFAVVGLTYPAILGVSLLSIALLIWCLA